MRYLVFGTGAVGGLIGARLALADHEVTFLARPRVTQATEENGLKLIEGAQTTVLPEVSAATEFETALRYGKPDLIILCVKAYDCAEAANTIAHTLSDPIPVLSMLNGISNEATLSNALGSDRVIPGTLTTAVEMPASDTVRVSRRRGIGIGGDHPMALNIVRDFAQAGFSVEHFPDADRMKWSKLMTNIVSNATSAITGLDPGEVFAHPGLARVEIDALRETVRVMRSMGLAPQNLPGVSVALLGRAIFLPRLVTRVLLGPIVARGRGQKMPSLHHDIGRGKSEVAWLNGSVARHGSRLGVPTPVNAALYRTMDALVHDASLQSTYSGNPEALLARVYPSQS